MAENNYIPENERDEIINNFNLVDYFFYLESQGKVRFDRTHKKDYYFRTENNKFSVNENNYFDFKSEEGGKAIKAVMAFEKLNWLDSLNYIKKFKGTDSAGIERPQIAKASVSNPSETTITKLSRPWNDKLLDYFQQRGISRDILTQHTRQVHYEHNDKEFFAIGIKNLSGGYDLRNPLMNSKIGPSDISVITGSKKEEIILFEGMADMLSFLQLMKDNNKTTNRTLVCLNSVSNVSNFINHYENFKGKLFLLLDGDKKGNEATQIIQNHFKSASVQDIRELYQIKDGFNKDLNDYLTFKIFGKRNFNTLVENNENETITTGQGKLPDTKSTGSGSGSKNNTKSDDESQSKSEKRGDSTEPSLMDGQNARNGSEARTESGAGNRTARDNGSGDQKSGDAEKRHSLATKLSGIKSTNIAELDLLLLQYNSNQNINNDQVAELVSAACFVQNDTVYLKENFEPTEQLIDLLSNYKSGGLVKEGRGILDEYYTDIAIVDTVQMLINKHIQNKSNLSVLEPSVGTGNFLNAAKNMSVNQTDCFEINETTAKIAKILNPNANVYLKSFEANFIDSKGFKFDPENYTSKYDLVIGNPPYGNHRGFYKGLGEETKLSRFEDYFVKRSLDTLKENGILAMVLPSSWIDRQKKSENFDLVKAYRLPTGAFKGTQVGTDIVILKKNSNVHNYNNSDYFLNHPKHILGEIKEKTNQFGRLEKYVHGDIDAALKDIDIIENTKLKWVTGNLFDALTDETSFNEIDIKSPADEKVSNTTKKNADTENPTPEIKNSIINAEKKETLKFKLEEALKLLQSVKFKSPVVNKEILNLEKIQNDTDKVTEDKYESLINDLDKIITSEKLNRDHEYLIQSKPQIKNGQLKYHFKKQDDIVNTSNQNNPNISSREIESFANTDYDGTISDVHKYKEFANFIDGSWKHNFYYAEGNIYAKLNQLEIDKAAFPDILTADQYNKQKSLLESVMPVKKSLEDIIISPNHEFVDKLSFGLIEQDHYNYETRKTETIQVKDTLKNRFLNFVDNLSHDAFAGSSSWEVRAYVRNEAVTGSDKDRNALVRERRKKVANDLFDKFIKEDVSEDVRRIYVEEFNKGFNNIHVPDYSRFPLFSKIHSNFKGDPLALSEVQKAGIGRLTTKGVGVLAHEVGFGKTLSGVLSMHEAMERKTAKRPLIVVPNESIMKQWVETIFETIPDAKVNVLGNLGVGFDLSDFENKDGDISIVTYSGFGNIGFSEAITNELSSKFSYISEREMKSVNRISERDVQKEIEKQKELTGIMKKGKIYDWEDFGFDHMTFDEVHNANHIVGKVNLQDRGFASDFRSQNQRTSGLGINTWMAAQYIQEQNNGRNVTLLSATPFTNKPLEYYSILSLVANNRLEEKGYFNVNNFFETFMEADNEMEIDAKGDVNYKSNVRRFKNNSVFQQLLSEFIDIKSENPDLVRPNRINHEYKIPQNDLTKNEYEKLNDNFSENEEGAILTHILNARLIAISPYLSPYYEGKSPTVEEWVENSPKLKLTMDLIAQNRKDRPDAGQIIYSELAVDNFEYLQKYLIEKVGFNEDEVAIISGKTSKNNRTKIQNDFNSGDIKVIIGSQAIQEGMNLQVNTSDMYLLSLPYNFTSLRQTEGRAWRQGNKWTDVRINYMLTKDSIDVFMLQKLQAKQSRYNEAMKNDVNVLDVSDINTNELKTSLITNPVTRAEIEIKVLDKRFQSEKLQLLADSAFQLRKQDKLLKIKEKISNLEKERNTYQTYYNDSGEGRGNFWLKYIEDQNKKIMDAKIELSDEIKKLEKSGVDVDAIEKNIEDTERKVAEIDNKLENLDHHRSELIDAYTKEAREKEIADSKIDFIKERETENYSFFQEMNGSVKEPVNSYRR